MTKPVVRSNWKIDPAELARAQERTEARLTELFDHRTGRWAGRRPPIVVDGVELIGSADAAPADADPAVPHGGPPRAPLPFGPGAAAGSAPAHDAGRAPVPVVAEPGEAAAPAWDGFLPLGLAVDAAPVEPAAPDQDPEVIPADAEDGQAEDPSDLGERAAAAALDEVAPVIDGAGFAESSTGEAAGPTQAVGVLDLPGPDLVMVAVDPQASDQLVGVMSIPDEIPAWPRQLSFVADPVAPVGTGGPASTGEPASEGEPTAASVPDDDAPRPWAPADEGDVLAVAQPAVGQPAVATDAEPAPGADAAPGDPPATASRRRRPVASAKVPPRPRARTGGAPTKAAGVSRTDKAAFRPGARRGQGGGVPAQRAVRAPLVAAAACPYCAVLLDPPPTASRRCGRCRQQIVVKRVDGRLAFLTEAAVAIFEAERQKEVAALRLGPLRERWLKLATTAGAAPNRVRRLAEARVSEEVVDSSRALYMATVDQAFLAARRERRWEDASEIRRGQALAVHRLAGSPTPPSEDVVALHREGVLSQLKGLAEIAREAELIGSDCCDQCRDGSGQAFSIAKELAAPRLPHVSCPKGLCRCGWDLAARDRDAILRYLRRHPRPSRSTPPGGVPPVAPATAEA